MYFLIHTTHTYTYTGKWAYINGITFSNTVSCSHVHTVRSLLFSIALSMSSVSIVLKRPKKKRFVVPSNPIQSKVYLIERDVRLCMCVQ